MTLASSLDYIYLFCLLLVCIYVCFIDVKLRQIRNSSLLSLLFLQIIFVIFKDPLFILSVLIFTSVGFIIYLFGFIGAGDIKYAAVLSLSLPMELLPQALLLTMLTGGVLAFIYFLLHLVRRIKANLYKGMEEVQYNPGIPYGVAISVGFYVMIFSHWVKYL
jgi:prepilin peptidase CpaA